MMITLYVIIMGIKLLNSFIKKHCREQLHKLSFADLSGKSIVVDASIYFYKFSENDLLIEQLYLMCSLFRYYNITPLFILDGKPPPEKKKELEQRSKKRTESTEKYLRLEELLNATKDNHKMKGIKRKLQLLKRKCLSIKSKDYKEIKSLFDNYGIQWMTAKGEADALCAAMVRDGKAYACLSEDMDLFVHGCPRVLRYMSLVQHNMVLYELDPILKQLKMNFKDFQIMCILSGTDYNHSKSNIFCYYNLYKLYRFSKCTDFIIWLSNKIRFNIDSILTLFNVTIETPALIIQFEDIHRNELVQQLEKKNFIFV